MLTQITATLVKNGLAQRTCQLSGQPGKYGPSQTRVYLSAEEIACAFKGAYFDLHFIWQIPLHSTFVIA